ncbi:MAG: helix-turn-helix transcriptional regulator [Cyanobacteria bacterium REEB65]|nr:helix-turn-helix transcriptional regulator [Cyanobacteria bacterium REEB65]
MPNGLGDFIARRRHELNLSRDAVAARAKRAGYALSASYIAKLEMGVNPNTGRPPRPTLDKIEALANGLGLVRDDLLRVIDGNGRRNEPASLPNLKIPSDVTQWPTEWELAVVQRISNIDWGTVDPRKDAGFWNLDRAIRRRILRNLEDIFLELETIGHPEFARR